MLDKVTLEEVIANLVALHHEIQDMPFPIVCQVYEKALNDLRLSYMKFKRYQMETEEIERYIARHRRLESQ
jgi:hypothetical protein